MTDVQTSFRLHLLDQAEIVEAVDQRVFADLLPQGATLPAIVLMEVSSTSEEHLGGGSGLGQMRLRAKVYAESHAQATQIRELLRTENVQGFRGSMHGLWIEGLSVAAKGTGTDPPDAGDTRWRWYKWTDFFISHNEDI